MPQSQRSPCAGVSPAMQRLPCVGTVGDRSPESAWEFSQLGVNRPTIAHRPEGNGSYRLVATFKEPEVMLTKVKVTFDFACAKG
jgi:hypothetical protein